MNAAQALASARRRAGVTQRELARKAGVPQPSIARIESGKVVPRVDTLERLLRACGRGLEVGSRIGHGVDRTAMRRQLKLTPDQRLDYAVESGRNLRSLVASAQRID